ncbi:MAG: nucleoside-diphosphate sugar epimerase [Anaerolineaceae bacterium]|nr:nucleoside-diphosphate sugar epimerase [Anaerolineaceae bacterium]
MRLLVVGASGFVGTLVVPFLAEQHQLRVFDRQPPQMSELDFVQGDVTCYQDLAGAMDGIDAVVYMAMGSLNWQEEAGIVSAYDVNIKGVHLALRAAHEAGVQQAVYTSSMSVYGGDLMQRTFPDEGITPDATNLYGFTKRMGEEVCQNAAREWGMNVNALRLCHPTAEEKWLEETRSGVPTIATMARDVANALMAAAAYQGGFQAFTISGDYEQKVMNMAKAKRLLGWEPLARPVK